ncbi:MAG: NADH-quinone oxidoreductase subunit G [Legionellaceae bacterium]|nr:NADH-quinone oxidoreductase subunit G [Legionellaceae bacterium]
MATIEIDGKKIAVENGKMIIEVADDAGIYIPRFCYHKKLSVAANCRMCLVEVENARKPVPACATPITDGMKVYTKSEETLRSQKAVMEFLLINHPLDCPVCDQGGECELQDISMGFGEATSDYEENKRSVPDEDLGSLISTEMTRCIHCTRCVRFGDEIAGLRELGATGRGENMTIGTYIKHSIVSEISGNVIDLCPVGALTSKPYRFTARAWEMTQSESIAPHDCLGTNVYLHVRRNQLMRVVPRENEQINETWISDRDRFSYTGLRSEQRVRKPMLRKEGRLQEVEWEEALQATADGVSRIIKQYGPEQFAAFASSSATTEECYLLQKWMRSLGVQNLDYRLQQSDFSDQEYLGLAPQSTLPYAEIEQQQHILLLGCNIVREVPLAGVRVRKAVQNGASASIINPVDFDCHFALTQKVLVSPAEMPYVLARVLLALVKETSQLPEDVQKLLLGLTTDAEAEQIAASLQREKSVIISGALCENHPQASLLRCLMSVIAQYSGATIVRLTAGANSAGAAIAGMLPHRGVAGRAINHPGLAVQEAIQGELKGYLLHAVEPAYDFANPYAARKAMLAAEFVVATSAFYDESMHDYVDVLLPIAPYAETSGSYVNIDLQWQSFKGALQPMGDARPAWKIFRVLGNLTQSEGFEHLSSEEVLDEVRTAFSMAVSVKPELYIPPAMPEQNAAFYRIGEWPLYRVDAITRHALPLQRSAAAESACIRLHPDTAERLKLDEHATITQGDIEITLALKRDERIVRDAVYVANGLAETADLAHAFAPITIKR